MGKKHLLRFGLASMLAGSVGLGGVLAACGDDEASNPGTNTPDTGTPDSTGNPDTGGGGDTGTPDTGVDAGPPLAKLTLVNAAVDLGPSDEVDINPNAGVRTQAVRICFKTGTTEQNLSIAPYPPLPREAPAGTPANTPPGLYLNTGGAFPSFGIDLEGRILVPIIMNAKTLAARGFTKVTDGGIEKVCDEILDPAKTTPALVEGKDFWTLDAIPVGTFKKDKSFLLGLTGCGGSAVQTTGAASICGPDFNGGGGKGNLKVNIFELTRTPAGANQGIQVANLSSPYGIIPGAARPFTPGFTADPTNDDAGAYRGAVAAPGTVELNKISAVNQVAVTDDDFFASNPDGFPPPGTGAVTAPIPLTTIQALSGLGTNTKPTVYVKGKNYVFASVGDPTASTYVDTTTGQGTETPSATTTFNLRKYHYLAFPTDPTVVPYKP